MKRNDATDGQTQPDAVELVEAHGTQVWSNTKYDALRKEHCLCVLCHKRAVCVQAKAFYALCKQFDVAFMTTRCPDWTPRIVTEKPKTEVISRRLLTEKVKNKLYESGSGWTLRTTGNYEPWMLRSPVGAAVEISFSRRMIADRHNLSLRDLDGRTYP